MTTLVLDNARGAGALASPARYADTMDQSQRSLGHVMTGRRWLRWPLAIAMLITSMGTAWADVGVNGRGKHPQGPSLQDTLMGDEDGVWLRGSRLIAAWDVGEPIEIHHFAGEVVKVGELWSATKENNEDENGDENATILHPRDLIGLQWSETQCDEERCKQLEFRIVAAEQDCGESTMADPHNRDNCDIWLHSVMYRPVSNAAHEWAAVCNPESGGSGLFIDGHWNPDGSWDAGGYTFSCLGGVVAKCTRFWGYKPWKRLVSSAYGAVDLQPLHTACTRAARAEYCGDGVSYTESGVTIDIADTYGLNTPLDDEQLAHESVFSPAGAVRVDRARVDELVPPGLRSDAPLHTPSQAPLQDGANSSESTIDDERAIFACLRPGMKAADESGLILVRSPE